MWDGVRPGPSGVHVICVMQSDRLVVVRQAASTLNPKIPNPSCARRKCLVAQLWCEGLQEESVTQGVGVTDRLQQCLGLTCCLDRCCVDALIRYVSV